jgi:hypothetical protein
MLRYGYQNPVWNATMNELLKLAKHFSATATWRLQYLWDQPPPSGRSPPREAWHHIPDHQNNFCSSEPNNHISVYTDPRASKIRASVLCTRRNLFDEVVSRGESGPSGASDGDLLPLGLATGGSLCPDGGPSAAAVERAAEVRRRQSASGDDGRAPAPAHSFRGKLPESRWASGLVVPARCSPVCPMHQRSSRTSSSQLLRRFTPLSPEILSFRS